MKFETVPKPPKKSYRLSQEFATWLLQKRIETIVDFDREIDVVHKISNGRKYIKKKIEKTDITYKAQDARYG